MKIEISQIENELMHILDPFGAVAVFSPPHQFPLSSFSAVTFPNTAGSNPLSFLFIVAAMSMLPFFLVTTTSFVKISVVLSILRNAIGTPQIPPAMVITGLSLVLSAYVMAPTGSKVFDALKEGTADRASGGGFFSPSSALELYRAAKKAREPIREFLLRHSRARDRELMIGLSGSLWPDKQSETLSESDFLVLMPAFVIGQLASAFKIGFLVFIPFLIIDLVVGNILLALGMHMLSPTTVSLPFKLLLFVMVDGWALIAEGLALSYR